MTKPELVIFDCDGVLVDTETLGNHHLVKMLGASGFETTFENLRRTYTGMPMKALQEKVEAQGYSLGADFVDRWYEAIPTLFENVEAIPHIEDVIAAVQKAEISYCVASSANIDKMRFTLDGGAWQAFP